MRKLPLYSPLDFVLVRAPVFPIEQWRDNSIADSLDSTAALATASLSMVAAAHRRPGTPKAATATSEALQRYAIRMTSRPTPFGMAAGVALARWGDQTDLRISRQPGRTHTRVDMESLFSFVWALESRAEIRRRLRFQAHSACFIRAGRIVLSGIDTSAPPLEGSNVSLRATAAVRCAVEAAREPVEYTELVRALQRSVRGATGGKVAQLLTSLWQYGFLISDLRPPITQTDPAGYVLRRLASIPEAHAAYSHLAQLLRSLSAWDESGSDRTASTFVQIAEGARAFTNTVSTSPLQVDMALDLEGSRINKNVADAACAAAELLLRMTPLPTGLPIVAAYREKFVARYGTEAEVPLLELVDSDVGLGSLQSVASAPPPALPRPIAARRERALLRIATTALHQRLRQIELDAALVSELQTWEPTSETAPLSLDIYAFVAATSAAEVDAGAFRFVVGPNTGANAAGRNLARFGHILNDATQCLKNAAQAEEDAGGNLRTYAELVFVPERLRSANVVIRPSVRRYEVGIAPTAGHSLTQRIPLDQISVMVRNGRFALRWTAAPEGADELLICAGHMLNHVRAPGLCRFLADVSRDQRPQLNEFDWGQVSDFPFLPRVTFGRVVLRPAQWRIDSHTQWTGRVANCRFAASLMHWREFWDVPRFVYAGSNLNAPDHRLLLDLECETHQSLLCAELTRTGANGRILLQEALPSPDEAWLPGPGGRYLAEIVISMRLSQRRRDDPLPPRPPAAARTNHIRPPGSDWLYVKLYCGGSAEEDVIRGPMRELSGRAIESGIATSWSFLRYSDPDPHLRLRFSGEPRKLRRLMPKVSAWAAELIEIQSVQRFCFETYEREIARYGGNEGMTLAEAVFAADSEACASLIEICRTTQPSVQRTDVAMVSIDDLLSALGLDVWQRLAWAKEQIHSRHDVSAEYRSRRTSLAMLLRNSESSFSPDVYQVLAERRLKLEPLAVRLAELSTNGSLCASVFNLCSSYVHLHCNRLLGRDRNWERRVLGLYLRTREQLSHLGERESVC